MSIDFEQHRREIESDPNRVRCAHCGAWIHARDKRCDKCGTHFKGEAFQFTHESDELADARLKRARRLRLIALIVVVAFAIGVVAFFAV